jgi:hypothetical protein
MAREPVKFFTYKNVTYLTSFTIGKKNYHGRFVKVCFLEGETRQSEREREN